MIKHILSDFHHKLSTVEIIYETQIKLSNIDFNHINIWDCTYEFIINKLDAHIVYFERDGIYYRGYKPLITGLAMVSKILDTRYSPIGNMIWGNDKFLECVQICNRCNNRNDLTNIIKSNVYFVDASFSALEFENDKKTQKELDLGLMINEIIGDG